MADSKPTLSTVRLILHVPPTGRALGHWTLMHVWQSGRVPHGDVLAAGNVPMPGGRVVDTEVWTVLDRIVREYVVY